MHCFAKFCHSVPCPRRPIGAPGCEHGAGSSQSLTFKYSDEGRSAVMHATALSLPGARFISAADSTPPRLHIEAPLHGSSGNDGGIGVLYTCKTCETADVVDPVSLNVTGCLFTRHPYENPVVDAARKVHSCRYSTPEVLDQVCSALGNAQQVSTHFPWWCQR